MLTDPIADMLTRIRNGLQARHPAVTMPSSKLKVSVAQVLRDEGFILGFQELEEMPQKKLRIELKYVDKNVPVVTGIKRVSRPACACIAAPRRCRESTVVWAWRLSRLQRES